MTDTGKAALRSYLRRYGVSTHALADGLGISRPHLSNELVRGPSRPMRARIEWWLQYPFWTSRPVWRARCCVFLATDRDPGQMTLADLAALARSLGIAGHSKRRSREEWILFIHDHFREAHRREKARRASE